MKIAYMQSSDTSKNYLVTLILFCELRINSEKFKAALSDDDKLLVSKNKQKNYLEHAIGQRSTSLSILKHKLF